MAFSSCQNYPVGFFNGHAEAATLDPLDLYLFLGDYQYECDAAGAPASTAGATVDLQVLPRPLPRSTAPIRRLRELHRTQPIVHIWDDHEVANNYSENNPRPSDLQRAAGYRVSFEWLPRMQFPREQFRIYNRFQHGRTADVILLDQRQYRTGDNDGQPRVAARPPAARLPQGAPEGVAGDVEARRQPGDDRAAAGRRRRVSGRRSTRTSGTATTPSATSCSTTSPPRGSRTWSSSPATSTPTWPTRCPQRPGPVYTPGRVGVHRRLDHLRRAAASRPPRVSAANPWIKTFDGVEHGYAQLDRVAERGARHLPGLGHPGRRAPRAARCRAGASRSGTNTPVQDGGHAAVVPLPARVRRRADRRRRRAQRGAAPPPASAGSATSTPRPERRAR